MNLKVVSLRPSELAAIAAELDAHLVGAVVQKAHATVPGRVWLELRSPDGTCNPYLLTAAVLAAGLDGVRRGLVPGPDLSGRDTSLLSSPERVQLGALDLPRSLDQALDALEADEVAREALGPTLFACFVGAKRNEARSHRASVSDWEYAHYLEHY